MKKKKLKQFFFSAEQWRMKWMWETNERNEKPNKEDEEKTKSDALTLNSNVTEHLFVPKKKKQKQIEIGNNFNRNRIGIMRASLEYAQDDYYDDVDDMMPTSYA